MLDADHYGLEKIKRRILEFLAVRKLNPSGKSADPVLRRPARRRQDLARPVDRARDWAASSCASAWAACMTRAEIRGHRRTYIGALPGSIIQAIRRAGSRALRDDAGRDRQAGRGGFQGDPASALLEVLDPEQNSTFRDNYLGVPFDLVAGAVHRHREQARHHPGAAARPHGGDPAVRLHRGGEGADRAALPGAAAAGGERADSRSRCEITDEALRAIIRDYTREAGVRNLEREIGSVLRNVAVRIAEGEREPIADRRRAISPRSSGQPRSSRRSASARPCRAWRPVWPGRRSAATSCSSRQPRMPGNGRLILTGQLGDVMKESAQAALSLRASRARRSSASTRRCFEKQRHPRPRPGGRDAEGRPVRGRGDVRRRWRRC